jgi:hypothetical protein
MEKGFFHPKIGYWQTNTAPSAEIFASYLAGTVEVPLIPSGDHQWNGSEWVYVAPPVDLEALAAQARAQRNDLLAASDWTQVPDAPVDQAAWATYRQALRDITAQAGFPTDINWPEAP